LLLYFYECKTWDQHHGTNLSSGCSGHHRLLVFRGPSPGAILTPGDGPLNTSSELVWGFFPPVNSSKDVRYPDNLENKSFWMTRGTLVWIHVSLRGLQSWKTWTIHGICKMVNSRPEKKSWKKESQKFWKSHGHVFYSCVHSCWV